MYIFVNVPTNNMLVANGSLMGHIKNPANASEVATALKAVPATISVPFRPPLVATDVDIAEQV